MQNNFRRWIERNQLSMYMLAKLCRLSRGTIKNLVVGQRTPNRKTVTKLVRATKSMKEPVTYQMFVDK